MRPIPGQSALAPIPSFPNGAIPCLKERTGIDECKLWEVEGLTLSKNAWSNAVAIGEWWNRGKKYRNRVKIVRSIEWRKAGGLSYKTCREYGSIVATFNLSSRLDNPLPNLEISHYQEARRIVGDDPSRADELLRLASENLWSKQKLRAEVNRSKRERPFSTDQESAAQLDQLAGGVTRFGAIYADPPWVFHAGGPRGSGAHHYPGMALDDICALPIRELAADDSHCHLWVPGSRIPDGLEAVMNLRPV